VSVQFAMLCVCKTENACECGALSKLNVYTECQETGEICIPADYSISTTFRGEEPAYKQYNRCRQCCRCLYVFPMIQQPFVGTTADTVTSHCCTVPRSERLVLCSFNVTIVRLFATILASTPRTILTRAACPVRCCNRVRPSGVVHHSGL